MSKPAQKFTLAKQQPQKNNNEKKPSGKRPTSGASSPSPPAAAAAAQSKQKAAPQDNQRYVVIITNVENDFGKLHGAALPFHCGLRAEYEETSDMDALIHASATATPNSTSQTVSAKRGCGFAVRCRTETRTAEVSLYGPADADFTPMMMPPPAQRGKQARASAPPTVKEDKNTTNETEEGDAAAVGVETVTATANAVEALALRLRRLRYCEDRLPVHVHLPGHEAGEVLLRARGADGPATPSTVGAASGAKAETKTNKEEKSAVGKKRTRSDDEADDGVDDCTSGDDEEQQEDEEEEAKKERAGGQAAPRAKVEAATDKSQGVRASATGAKDTADNNSSQHQNKKTKAAERAKKNTVVLKQFGSRQKDFVTAIAAPMAPVSLPVMRRRLHDLPGYMSCWSVNRNHVRVVFRDADSLYKAKPLLETIGLGQGLRVDLMLSDTLARGYEDHVRLREAEGLE